MMIQCITCTDRGEVLAGRLAGLWEAETGYCIKRCARDGSLAELTRAAFEESEAVIFISATGIAVRAIAPFLKNKAKDPAVICLDELGTFTISLVSGHLGGANELTRKISGFLGNIPVITTATDLHGLFAVDEWSKKQNCALLERQRIKMVSTAVLASETVTVFCPFPIEGEAPQYVRQGEKAQAKVLVDYHVDDSEALHLVPRILHVGVGCRRGIAQENIEAAWEAAKKETGIWEEAVADFGTIDLKKDEQGLLAFAKDHGKPLNIFTAEELLAVPGEYTESTFVKSITGVSNVCERSAVAGGGSNIILRKYALNGVTIAIAEEDYHPDWHWLNQ